MRLPVLVLACAAAACGGGSASPDATPPADAGPNDLRLDRVGFVNLIEGGGFLSVFAALHDRPDLPIPTVGARDGECTVWVRPPPASCDPPCTAGVCATPGECTPYPEPQSAGPITVTGLVQPLVFQEGPFGYTPEPPPGADLFAPGAAITVSAPGDAVPGFSTALTGVETLVAPFQNLTLVDDEDATVTWTAAGAAPIQIALVVGWHGAPPEAILVCETADDGAFTIPGGIIAELPRSASLLEQHSSWIQRFERDVLASPAGPIEVVVASSVSVYFTHP